MTSEFTSAPPASQAARPARIVVIDKYGHSNYAELTELLASGSLSDAGREAL